MGCTEIEQPSHYVTDWLDRRAKLTPGRVALIDYSTGSETTYACWNERANRTANYLRSLGVGKGDRLARYKLPRSIIVLQSMPLTAIGKLDKKLLASKEIKA